MSYTGSNLGLSVNKVPAYLIFIHRKKELVNNCSYK